MLNTEIQTSTNALQELKGTTFWYGLCGRHQLGELVSAHLGHLRCGIAPGPQKDHGQR